MEKKTRVSTNRLELKAKIKDFQERILVWTLLFMFIVF
jgi:hypothetical protein